MAEIKQVATLEAKTKGVDEAAKQFETLSNGVKKTADSAQNLDAKFEDVFQGVEPLTTRLGEAEDRMYELALAGDTTSQEYQDLLNKVAQYRKVQIETDRVVDQAAQTFSQKLGTAIGGVTSGFAVVQGSMALVGGESEALEKSLLKVQSALAIQQGVAGVLEYSRSAGLATKATKLWNLALKNNPIGLVIAGVVALIAVVGTLAAAFNSSADARKEDYEAQLNQIDATKKQIEDRKNQLKLEGRYAENRIKELQLDRDLATSKEEIAAIDKKIVAERIAGFEREREAVRSNQETAIQDALKQQKRMQKQFEDELDKTFFKSKERIAAAKKEFQISVQFTNKLQKQLQEDNFQGIVEINTRQKEFEQNLQKESIEEEAQTNQEKLDNYKDYLRGRLNAARRIEDLENELMDEGLEKELEINRDTFRRQREDTKAQGKQKQKIIDLLNELELKKEKEIREKFDVFKLESFDGEIAQLKLQSVKEIEIKKLTNEEIEKQMSESAARQKVIDDKSSTDKRANAIAVADANLTIAHDSLGAIGELANAFAKDDEKNAKKAFNINKAVGIAQAVVSTAQGIMAQLAVPQDALTGANFIKAGIVAATGAAQIATISKSKFQGGGGDTPSLDTSGGDAQAPSFNVVGDSGVNQLAQLQQQPVQAFVVSGEVTTSQALDRNRVENATL